MPEEPTLSQLMSSCAIWRTLSWSLGWGLVSACATPAPEPAPREVVESPVPEATPSAWMHEVNAVEERIRRDRALAEQSPGDWSRWERVALGRHALFLLTADLHDLLAARDHLDTAFGLAPEGSGPWLTAATVYTSLHNLDRAADALDHASRRLMLNKSEQAAILRQQAAVARLRGHLPEARQRLAEARALAPGLDHAIAEAQLEEKVGAPSRALALYREALELQRPGAHHSHAWLQLQVARLEQVAGNLDAATTAVETAEAAFPGWFAVSAAKADLLLATEDRAAAITLLQECSQATPHPEYTARLAVALAETDLFAAEELFRTASARMNAWTTAAPGAMATHAAELALARGEVERARELARAHASTHHDVDALVLLARAEQLAGHPEAAREVYAKATDGTWSMQEVAWLCRSGGCPVDRR